MKALCRILTALFMMGELSHAGEVLYNGIDLPAGMGAA